ncbi:NADPH-dependent FMN reductase [Paenibacillus crassostreae]|uniref:FMN reductase n=1 Tax=Paenibacillus crassostreae TaxID=1763538 RepID=A0A167B8U6_9BACL|nr:NADPH-dependent FMN reductase [Paenibacillus crassostreae]AOZ93071.1 FMN reductase [Paenibacillus crassostreae]OAB71840.1 FMN reductase [Paenibacillus crassostreae]
MKIVGISGSIVGSKTRTAMNYVEKELLDKYSEVDWTLLDLADFDIQFSDGRNYLEYEGDTRLITKAIMEADAIVIGTPIFQASIPATLKNLFDLLPVNALRDKIVSMVITAGSSKHFLIAEQQLKPILSYMKAQIVQTYVFIEEMDFHRKEIVNDDISFRIARLVEDTVVLTESYAKIRTDKENEYDF